MIERKYSVAEIDRMRVLVRFTIPDGTTFYGEGVTVWIEERLRTYMMAGIGPEELQEELNRRVSPSPAPALPGG